MEAGSVLFFLSQSQFCLFSSTGLLPGKRQAPCSDPWKQKGLHTERETPSFSEHLSCVEPFVGTAPAVSSALDGTGVSAVSERAHRVLIVSVLMKTIVNWSCSGPLCVSHNALLSTFTQALPKEGVIILISKPRKLRLRDW